jgi:hypothetical protein
MENTEELFHVPPFEILRNIVKRDTLLIKKALT